MEVLEAMPVGAIAAVIGVIAGLVLGLAARFGGFGTLSALRAAAELGDQRRVRLWGIVIGVAIVASFALDTLGYARIAATPYHAQGWYPVAVVLGGLTFGYGMALAGSCGFEALVRAGAGDLRALVIVAVLGIAALAVTSGPLAGLKAMAVAATPLVAPTGIAQWLSGQIGLSPFFFAVILAACLIASGLSYLPLRRSPARLLWGVAVGLTIAGCFAATTWLNASTIGRMPVDGPSFATALGQGLLALMTPPEGSLSFAAGLTGGVLLGAFLGALFRGFFRASELDEPLSLGRIVSGAALMGFGGALAGGDLVGQGMTGMAVLAWTAPVAMVSILAGCALGHRWVATAAPAAPEGDLAAGEY
ncbi:MAG: YeeE/YedE family protein [Paracoccaceae bacterium]